MRPVFCPRCEHHVSRDYVHTCYDAQALRARIAAERATEAVRAAGESVQRTDS